jgi:transcription elongation factor GreA
MADGPVRWGRPIPASGQGVFVIELPDPLATAPLELTRVGKWIERVATLRLDGARPTSRALAARLAAFWLPSQTILYVGATDASIARRLAAIEKTELGDRRPQPAAHWLKTMRSLDALRIWWSPTDATEEYEDALLAAFASGVPAADLAALPDRSVVLPWANLRSATGDRKATGLTGSILAEPAAPPLPGTRIVVLPDGDAEGARGEPPPSKARPTRSGSSVRPSGAATASTATGAAVVRAAGTGSTARAAVPARAEPPDRGAAAAVDATALTPDGAARLRAELDELIGVRRPEVVARIRTAKEHGDLKENAEYHAAREEQSFLEGRIQAIEKRLRTAVIVSAPAAGSRVGLGSVVTVDDDGETVAYTIVGAAEADPGRGRISSASPVGRGLLGRDVGDVITVATPAGDRSYRILAVD